MLAVDPSSPFSGGALLGDRVRMGEHATDPGVFIRSMATRGHLGGLAAATPQALRVLDAAGCDVILVETVGVGQSEVEVVALADTTVVLLAPGMGDGVQAAKAGILEVADVFVVNKADRDGADATVQELQHMISLNRREVGGPSWRPPVVRTVAAAGQGIDDLVAALDRPPRLGGRPRPPRRGAPAPRPRRDRGHRSGRPACPHPGHVGLGDAAGPRRACRRRRARSLRRRRRGRRLGADGLEGPSRQGPSRRARHGGSRPAAGSAAESQGMTTATVGTTTTAAAAR